MDQHSTLDQRVVSPAAKETTAGARAHTPSGGNAAGIAPTGAFVSTSSALAQFPGEDGGQSLVQMAQSDLDAALQLLADRAHYITGASGAAIALRRGEHTDMICRASAGSNAPELGALLSMEYGISGESARTRQPLLCEDTETDPRVNRQGCRQLGIASVVVMPILCDGQTLGVFELFSGKPHAFGERDLSALQRLSEMVVTAVKHAIAAQTVPVPEDAFFAESEISIIENPVEEQLDTTTNHSVVTQPEPQPEIAAATPGFSPLDTGNRAPEKTIGPAAPQKPVLWSAAMQAPTTTTGTNEPEQLLSVPPVLRNLQKCQACGFPVSQGRTFCVECEEKQWRAQSISPGPLHKAPAHAFAQAKELPLPQVAVPSALTAASQPSAASETPVLPATVLNTTSESSDVPSSSDSVPFLNSTLPAESWLGANKYILVALLVAAIIVMILWIR